MMGQGGTGSGSAPFTLLTQPQITELCGRISAQTEDAQWTGLLGYCSRKALSQPTEGKTCEQSADECYRGTPVLPDCGSILADCPAITIDQYVACRVATIREFLSFNTQFSCSSMPPFPTRPVSQACVQPYQVCPGLAMYDPG
jgi:hypothetical protein